MVQAAYLCKRLCFLLSMVTVSGWPKGVGDGQGERKCKGHTGSLLAAAVLGQWTSLTLLPFRPWTMHPDFFMSPTSAAFQNRKKSSLRGDWEYLTKIFASESLSGETCPSPWTRKDLSSQPVLYSLGCHHRWVSPTPWMRVTKKSRPCPGPSRIRVRPICILTFYFVFLVLVI